MSVFLSFGMLTTGAEEMVQPLKAPINLAKDWSLGLGSHVR